MILLQSLITIAPTTSLQDTMKILSEHSILAVAVQDPLTKKLEGLVSMYEIMSYIAWKAWNGEEPSSSTPAGLDVHLEAPASVLLGTTGVDGNDDKRGLWVLEESGPLRTPLELFGKGVYRVVVNTKTGTKLVTQSDLIRWLSKNWSQLGSEKDATVADLPPKKVFTINAHDSALYAFRHLRAKEVQGFPIVDAHGKLFANISVSDLRGISPTQVAHQLPLNVIDFLRGRNEGQIRPPVTCSPNERLSTVIERILASRLHRIWVVDAAHKPVSVVTLTDLALHIFSSNLALWYPAEAENDA